MKTLLCFTLFLFTRGLGCLAADGEVDRGTDDHGNPINLPDQLRVNEAIVKMLREDPRDACRFLEGIEAEPIRREAMRCLIREWCERDAAQAKRWAFSLTVEQGRNDALSDLCYQIAGKNIKDAVTMTAALGPEGFPVMEDLLCRLAERDFSAAIEHAIEASSGRDRDQILSRLAVVEAKANPEFAATLVFQQIPEGPIQTEALMSIMAEWAKHNMAEARLLAAMFPSGPIRDRAERELSGIEAYQKDMRSTIGN